MSIRSRSEDIDSLFISTYTQAIGDIRDNIFDAKKNVLMNMLRQKNGILEQRGGEYIKFDLEDAANSTIYDLEEGDSIAHVDFELLDQARYKWRYTVMPIVYSWHKMQQNEGIGQVRNLITQKIGNTQKSFRELIDARLFETNAANNKQHGLQHLIADTPSSQTDAVGEIVPSTNSYWRNVSVDFNGTYGGTSDEIFYANYIDAMRGVLQDVVPANEVDIIITNKKCFNLIKNDQLTYAQIDPKDKTDLGFPAQVDMAMFENVPIFWSKNIGNRMYFLNMDTIKYVVDPRYFFKLSNFKDSPSQPGTRIAEVLLVSNFVTTARRANGVIYNLPS